MAYRNMIGKSYTIGFCGDKIKVDCIYRCPYCEKETEDNFTVPIDKLSLIERGGWFETLKCEHCEKIANVRFWHDMLY